MVDSAPPIAPVTASGATAAQGGLTPLPVTVTAVPASLQQLSRQLDLGGTLTQGSDPATLTLTTALGNLTLTLPQAADAAKQQAVQQLLNMVDTGKTVSVALQPGSPPGQGVVLVPTTGGGAAANTATTALAPQPNAATTLPLTVPPAASNAAPALSAIVLPPDVVIPGAAAAPASASQAAALPLTLNAVTQSSPVATAPIAGTVVAQAPLAAAGATPALPPPGTEITVQIAATAPPGAALPPATGNQIAATVIGNGPQGQVILRAADTVLYVREPINVPAGSSLLITVAAARDAATVLKPAADTAFQPLQAALAALAQADPQLAAKLIETALPQPNAQLPGTLLFFLNVLQQGDARGWLGKEAADTLAQFGKAALIDKLAAGFRGAVAAAQDDAVGQWQYFAVPLQAEGQMQMLNFYVHRDPQRQSPGEGGDSESAGRVTQTRFLIDVRMSRLGAVQLDGLTHLKKLDMIVRSENVLPPSLPAELRAVYTDTLSAIGYSGELNFQTGRKNWLVLRTDGPQSAVM